MNLQNLLEQARKMQAEFARIQEEAKKKTIEAETGGGMVKVVIDGSYRVKKVEISDEALAMNDKEALEDLIVAALNKASSEMAEFLESELSSMKSLPFNIPGLNLPF